MFFVTEGELEVEVDGFRKRLSADFFGEIALLEDELRSATVRALTRCQLLVLEKVHFQELLASIPRIDRTVKAAANAHRRADGQRRDEKGE